MSTRRFAIGAFLFFAVNLPSLSTQDSPIATKPVWSWSEDCHNKKNLGLEVLMRGKIIYRSSLPICPGYREEASPKILRFFFKGGYVFQEEHLTTVAQTIEGNVWQAGTDPGTILLGVSFDSGNQVLFNTIHFAKIGRVSTTVIDRGLIIRTFPVRGKS